MKKTFVMAVAILFSAATMAQTTKQPKRYKIKKDSSYMIKDSISVMYKDTSSMKKNNRSMKKKMTTRPMKDSMPK